MKNSFSKHDMFEMEEIFTVRDLDLFLIDFLWAGSG